MMKSRLLLGALLILIMVVSLSHVVEASNNLVWKTNRVYFDNNDRLVLEGFFLNNGERTIVKVNQIRFKVDVGGNEDKRRIADFTVYNKDIYLEPGQALNYKFWTTDADWASTSTWSVTWTDAKWTYE
jgi:hypothetical protein